MSNYGKCKHCEWGEPESSGWKWYCSWYKTYEDPDITQDCPHFKVSGSGSSGCFLTTACCDYKGLPDDCYELETMRKLRDTYIAKQSYGKKLIKGYYAEAPLIVAKINQSENREEILEKLYEKIRDIAALVDAGELDEAVIYYMMLLHDLSKQMWEAE